jgi:hypothetical protein
MGRGEAIGLAQWIIPELVEAVKRDGVEALYQK